MKIIRRPSEIQREMECLRSRRITIGLVPTMGALHEGHLSLVQKARKENRRVVVSLFVNPLQFGPREDFRRYPRSLSSDQKMLAREGVDDLFIPSLKTFYPCGFQTFVEVPGLSQGLDGKFRPGHFRGVATVVTKLFNLIRPHRAYFGLKDYQQARIIQRLAKDLDFNIEIKLLPLMRDKDGLALSSRNRYLSREERTRAHLIPRALRWAQGEMERKHCRFASVRGEILKRLRKAVDRLDYLELVEAKSLEPVRSRSRRGRKVLVFAGWVGKTRLIDNVIMRPFR